MFELVVRKKNCLSERSIEKIKNKSFTLKSFNILKNNLNIFHDFLSKFIYFFKKIKFDLLKIRIFRDLLLLHAIKIYIFLNNIF